MSAEQNWWDDRTMPNNDGPDWERDADGVLWQIDPQSGQRRRVEPLYYLRYKRDIPEGIKFSSIRYPWTRDVTREQAEHMRASMPVPDKFEIVEST